jgi:interferon gamma-inducible protein 30
MVRIATILAFSALPSCAVSQATVTVDFYTESLCPDCEALTGNQLFNLMYLLKGRVDLTIVPYGNAKTSIAGVVTCQHGEAECQGNEWENCAIAHYPSVTQHFEFFKCMEAKGASMLTSVPACAAQAIMDYDVLATCFGNSSASDEGYLLHMDAGRRTPTHQYVPWILINGVLSPSEGQVLAKALDQSERCALH